MERFDEFAVDTAGSLGVAVDESHESPESQDHHSQEHHEEHVEESVYTDDPVRVYLREMGSVSLLNRQGEIDLATRMERGKLLMRKAISRSPMVWRNVLALQDDFRQAEGRLDGVFELGGLDEEARDDARAEVTRRLGRFARRHNALLELERKLSATPARYVNVRSRLSGEISRAKVRCSQEMRAIPFLTGTVEAIPAFGGARLQRNRQAGTGIGPGRKSPGSGSRDEAADPGAGSGRRGVRLADAPLAARGPSRRSRGRGGQSGARGSQPPAGSFHRQKVCQPRPAPARPDSGRQHRADARGRQVRLPPRLQIFHLCNLVGAAGGFARHCRPVAYDSCSGSHEREPDQVYARRRGTGKGTGALAEKRRDRPPDGDHRREGAGTSGDFAGSCVARSAGRPRRRVGARGLARR